MYKQLEDLSRKFLASPVDTMRHEAWKEHSPVQTFVKEFATLLVACPRQVGKTTLLCRLANTVLADELVLRVFHNRSMADETRKLGTSPNHVRIVWNGSNHLIDEHRGRRTPYSFVLMDEIAPDVVHEIIETGSRENLFDYRTKFLGFYTR